MKKIAINGLTLSYRDSGDGLPFVFQHGLGGDAHQTADVVPLIKDGATPLRVVTLECRGQGASPLGADEPSISQFAQDVSMLIQELNLDKPVIGGISMGAAIALRLAAQNPNDYRGLVIARPAWNTTPSPPNMQVFALAAALMKTHGAQQGLLKFAETPAATELRRQSQDNYSSLMEQFQAPDTQARARLLAAIAADGPGVSQATLATLKLPTVVIGNADDVVHPLSMAQSIAAAIPSARFTEIPSKTVSRDAYRAAFQKSLMTFFHDLTEHQSA